MQLLHSKGYLFPQSIRMAFIYGCAFGTMIFTTISGFLWYLFFTQITNLGVYGMLACLFTALDGYFLFSFFQNVGIVNARYEICEDAVYNYWGKRFSRVKPNVHTQQAEATIRLSLGKGNVDVQVILITEIPYFVNTYQLVHGLKAVNSIWKSGIVMLPHQYSNGETDSATCLNDA